MLHSPFQSINQSINQYECINSISILCLQVAGVFKIVSPSSNLGNLGYYGRLLLFIFIQMEFSQIT